MPNVVMAHDDPGATVLEEEILRSLAANVVHLRELENLPSMAIASQVDALMVGTERVSGDLLRRLPGWSRA